MDLSLNQRVASHILIFVPCRVFLNSANDKKIISVYLRSVLSPLQSCGQALRDRHFFTFINKALLYSSSPAGGRRKKVSISQGQAAGSQVRYITKCFG